MPIYHFFLLSVLIQSSYQHPTAPGIVHQVRNDSCDPTQNQTFPASGLISGLIDTTGNTYKNYAHRLVNYKEVPTHGVCEALQDMKEGDFVGLLDQNSFYKYPTFGKCELTLTEDVGVLSTNNAGLSDVVIRAFNAIGSISRFDLFHGHLFINEHAAGVVFHSMEYPKQDNSFPYPLGWCQANSTVTWNDRKMSRRNHLLLIPFPKNRDTNACAIGSKYKVSLWEIHGENIGRLFPGEDVGSPMYTMYTELFGLGLSDVVYLGPSTKLAWSPLPQLPCNR